MSSLLSSLETTYAEGIGVAIYYALKRTILINDDAIPALIFEWEYG